MSRMCRKRRRILQQVTRTTSCRGGALLFMRPEAMLSRTNGRNRGKLERKCKRNRNQGNLKSLTCKRMRCRERQCFFKPTLKSELTASTSESPWICLMSCVTQLQTVFFSSHIHMCAGCVRHWGLRSRASRSKGSAHEPAVPKCCG